MYYTNAPEGATVTALPADGQPERILARQLAQTRDLSVDELDEVGGGMLAIRSHYDSWNPPDCGPDIIIFF